LHNVTNIEILNPLVLVQKAKYGAHVWLVVFVVLVLVRTVCILFLLNIVGLLAGEALNDFSDDRVEFEGGTLHKGN